MSAATGVRGFRLRRAGAAVLLAVVTATGAAACSGGDGAGSTTTTRSGDAGTTTTAAGAAPTTAAGAADGDGTVTSAPAGEGGEGGEGGGEERDRSSATTALLPAESGLPDALPTNSKGDPIALDETALLACAQNQIAWVELQQDGDAAAAEALGIAATRAGDSAVAEVKAAADGLRSAARSNDPGPVVEDFLALCVERGFEY